MRNRAAALVILLLGAGCAEPNHPPAGLGDAATGGSGGRAGVDGTASPDVPMGGGGGSVDAPATTPLDAAGAETASCDPGSGMPRMCGDRCGACCVDGDCPAQSARVASCETSSLTCRYACPAGQRDCNGKCIAAGTCCSDADCPMMSGRVGKCDSSTNMCGYQCASDMKPCGATCIAQTGCCDDTQCTGNRACVNNACSTTQCRNGFMACGDRCIPAGQCCEAQPCSNNCGQSGTRPCNNGVLGACSVPNRACCAGDTMACSNSCAQSGQRTCGSNGSYGSCSVTDATCRGGRNQPCRAGARPTGSAAGDARCDDGLFCCDAPAGLWCSAEQVNTCQPRRGAGGYCDYASNVWCDYNHYCNGDDDTCHRRSERGGICSPGCNGCPQCMIGLVCNQPTQDFGRCE